jgi:hypothetical protein
MAIGVLLLLALGVNVPLGYLRSRCRKLSWPWFAYVHLSIPLIATCRILSGLRVTTIPLLVCGACAGQVLGARARRLPRGASADLP